MIRLILALLLLASPAFANGLTNTAKGKDQRERDKQVEQSDRSNDRPLAEIKEKKE